LFRRIRRKDSPIPLINAPFSAKRASAIQWPAPLIGYVRDGPPSGALATTVATSVTSKPVRSPSKYEAITTAGRYIKYGDPPPRTGSVGHLRITASTAAIIAARYAQDLVASGFCMNNRSLNDRDETAQHFHVASSPPVWRGMALACRNSIVS
jgi:hypothetical protein